MADQDAKIAQLVELANCAPGDARALLEASNWSVEEAVNLFYASGDTTGDQDMAGAEDVDEADSDYEPPAQLPASSSTAPAISGGSGGRTLAGGIVGAPASGSATPEPRTGSAAGKRRTGGLMTLGDLKGSGGGPAPPGPHADDDDDDDDEHDFFTGGEKSGLAVENPNKGRKDQKTHDSLIKDILKRAEEGSKARRENPPDIEGAEAGPSKPRFTGQGHTLGSDDVPSQIIPDEATANPKKLDKATRRLTFWKNGFSIEDGPLMRYDDPAHRQTLQSIQSGRAPLHLMNVEPNQPTDVHVYRKMDEDYQEPPKKFVPFSGAGNRLGAPTPGGLNAGASSSSSSPAPPVQAAAELPPVTRTVDVDTSAPTTTIQIRLGDGSKLVSKFNHTHTVADLYAFVNASNTQSRTRSYVLQTTFPTREMKDHDKTVKEEGLINAVVVQKWT